MKKGIMVVTILFCSQVLLAQSWTLVGNSNADANSVLGTKNLFPVRIMVNNIDRMRVDADGIVKHRHKYAQCFGYTERKFHFKRGFTSYHVKSPTKFNKLTCNRPAHLSNRQYTGILLLPFRMEADFRFRTCQFNFIKS